MIKSLLESLEKISLPLEDNEEVSLRDVAVLEPHLIWLDVNCDEGGLSISVQPVSESFLFIEIQVVSSNGAYRQVLAVTNNPRHIVEGIKSILTEAKVRKKLIKCKIGRDETTSRPVTFEAIDIVVPEEVFNKWYQIIYNKDTLVIFDTALFEVSGKTVSVREYNDVFKLILSLPPWELLFKTLIEILEKSTDVKKRTVKAVRHGKGYTVAIGKPDSTEYKRYKIPYNGKNIILLVPEED